MDDLGRRLDQPLQSSSSSLLSSRFFVLEPKLWIDEAPSKRFFWKDLSTEDLTGEDEEEKKEEEEEEFKTREEYRIEKELKEAAEDEEADKETGEEAFGKQGKNGN